jgi:NDP-sugar pyrophosphorylase family protein
MKAVILAAGEGTRMRPVTLETPKPLIEINGEKIIDKIFNSLPDEIDEVILVVEYLKDKIIDYVGLNFKNKTVKYSVQNSTKGTYGALLSAKNLFDTNERFLVINGDDIHDKEELTKYLGFPRSFGVQKMIWPNYYSIKIEDGLVQGFSPQTETEKSTGTFVATGAYVLDTNIFKHEGITVGGNELGLPQTILAQKEEFPINAVISEKWIPINSFDDLSRASEIL